MAVHNGERFLRDSIESILTQLHPDFEFIVVNDGSTDRTQHILRLCAGQDARVRILEQENQGLTRSLIRGCLAARGKYIARQDADDLSTPDRIVKLAQLLEVDPGLVFASSWAEWIGPEDELLWEMRRPSRSEEATRQLLHEGIGPPAHGSAMFRKESYQAAGGYREEFYYGQDSDLWLRLGQLGRLGYVQETLYRWRFNLSGITVTNRTLQRRFGKIGQECHAARMRGESDRVFLREADGLRRQILSGAVTRTSDRKLTAAANYFVGSRLAQRGDHRSREYLLRTTRANPLNWRAWLRICGVRSGFTPQPVRCDEVQRHTWPHLLNRLANFVCFSRGSER